MTHALYPHSGAPVYLRRCLAPSRSLASSAGVLASSLPSAPRPADSLGSEARTKNDQLDDRPPALGQRRASHGRLRSRSMEGLPYRTWVTIPIHHFPLSAEFPPLLPRLSSCWIFLSPWHYRSQYIAILAAFLFLHCKL